MNIVKLLHEEEHKLEKQLHAVQAAINALNGAGNSSGRRVVHKKGRISAAGRAAISKAAKARWAKIRAGKK